MSRKKEINVFNVAFLDLLSGALGAILILFVIVPKLDSKIRQQLQELETFQSLKLEVKEIQGMMSELSASVPKDQLSQLQGKFSSLQTNISTLEQEIKELQVQLGKCDDEKAKVVARNKSLTDEIAALKKQLGTNSSLAETLKKENAQLRNKITSVSESEASLKQEVQRLETLTATLQTTEKELTKQIEAVKNTLKQKSDELDNALLEIEELKKMVSDLKNENTQLADENETMKKGGDANIAELAELKSENSALKREIERLQEAGKGKAEEDKTGVTFKDKNILFVVDISGSMDDDPEPEKLDQVKAGLKMLIATMNSSYKIDVIVFPKSNVEDYDALYGKMTKVTENTKFQVYNYISRLRARYCTPTRSVMDFIYNETAYNEAGTITFLSDGLPTYRDGDDCPQDDYNDVIRHITKLNNGSKTINTLGVGAVYRNNIASDSKVRFMKKLAAQNDGFFIGF